ncbi:E3 UFM1-protein ligase 1 [Sarcoptes scabiei]|nr:E3 UFM1-protein ligase 1 [Sarcoptes scabiei]
MHTSWEEVKKLASDFQRAQQISSVLKLSEKNCVDIVKKLIAMKQINVFFTNDGKEYLTSDHLKYEIQNELFAAGGRISVPDLTSILNVDYGYVEAAAESIARESDGQINMMLGQLVSKEYKDNIASEIDVHLQESGSLNIGDLSKQYDMPTDFLVNLVRDRLDSLIQGKLDDDSRMIYTYDYLARFESKIIGIFSAITRSVTLQSIQNRYNIPEKILIQTLNELIAKKRFLGSISGSSFIPDIYARNRQDYIINFYKHNRYIDYSTLNKLSVSNPKNYLQKIFADQLCYLNSCAIDSLVLSQTETCYEDIIQGKNFYNLYSILPSILTSTDVDMLVSMILTKNKNFSTTINEFTGDQTYYVISKAFLDQSIDWFHDRMQSLGESHLTDGTLQNFFSKNKSNSQKNVVTEEKHEKRDQDQSINVKKGKKGTGIGGQGREIKTKAVKKKYQKSSKQSSDRHQDIEGSETTELPFISMDEVKEILSSKLSKTDAQEDLIELIAEKIFEDLKRKYESYAKELFVSHNAKLNKSKKSFAELQSFVNSTYSKFICFHRSISFITSKASSTDLASKLSKHLLKSIATDIVNELIGFFTETIVSDTISQEARGKLLSKLPTEYRVDFAKLNDSLISSEIINFIESLEKCTEKINLMLKRIDPRTENLVLNEHQQNLLIQLNECNDSILCLHIIVLLVFQLMYHKMLHASGKFVPQIILFLQKDVNNQLFDLIRKCQENVLKVVSMKDSEEKARVQNLLDQSINECKHLLNDFIANKKSLKKSDENIKNN